MARLKPSAKQIEFASQLGIADPTSYSAKHLSKLIDQALSECKQQDNERIERASEVDMLELAEQYTTLKRQSQRYHCGPCPMRCGAATDGFVVDTHHNAWFCRKCDDKGTPISFLMKRENLSFWDAVAELVGERNELDKKAPRLKPVKKPNEVITLWHEEYWQRKAQRIVRSSERRLAGRSKCASQARDYLNNERAISMSTAQVWRLGQKWVSFKNKKKQFEEANAIVIPWFGPDGLIKAIQYRFVSVENIEYFSTASRRFHGEFGGEKTIYGTHLLAPSLDKLLFVVEGEFNANSIWQEVHHLNLPVDVISLGGEGIGDERLTKLVKLAAKYRSCVAWLDRKQVAQKVGGYLEDALLLKSSNKRDANKLAQSGELASIVKAIYQRFDPARTFHELAPVHEMPTVSHLFDLMDKAGWLVHGLTGQEYAKGDELYKAIELAVIDCDAERVLAILGEIKALATGQAWHSLARTAELEKRNALFL